MHAEARTAGISSAPSGTIFSDMSSSTSTTPMLHTSILELKPQRNRASGAR